MTVQTLLAYLLGSRPAIERVVADPWAVGVGLALVLSAGLARSYRSRDLARQPWHLVLPLAAALVLSLLLYGVVAARLAVIGAAPGLAGLRSVAALVLLTAPLAWLYAIPFDRSLPWPRAVRARLITLGVVAVWRVALVVRAMAVLLDDRLGVALCLVLLVADAVTLTALAVLSIQAHPARPNRQTPMLIHLMGGIEPVTTPPLEQRLTARITTGVAIAGGLSLLVWIMGAFGPEVSADHWQRLLDHPESAGSPAGALWLLAGGAIVLFGGLLPWAQRRPRLRSRVEALLARGEIVAALRLMSAHTPADFPAGWQPPPFKDFRDPPELLRILELTLLEPAAEWVRSAYRERLRAYLAEPLWYWHYDTDLERLATLLGKLPEGPQLARFLLSAVQAWKDRLRNDGLGVRFRREQKDFEGNLWMLPLWPEPEPTERRGEIVAGLERLAQTDGQQAERAGSGREPPTM
jgi:hypothetical protein